MTDVNHVRNILASWAEPKTEGEWVIIPTSCSYRSNKTVKIYLLGGKETVRAYDGGGAFDELDGGGEYDFDAFKVLERFSKRSGIAVDRRGWLGTAPVPYDELPSLIPYLANVSVEASDFLRSRRRKRKFSDLREELNRVLLAKFDDAVHRHGQLIGASSKNHKFDFLVESKGDRRLAIDAALPDASSINSIVVRHLDVRGAKIEGVSQLIVYDDRESWKAADISLLRTGGQPFAFSRLPESLSRLVSSPPN